MVFRGVLAPLLLASSASAIRMSTDDVEETLPFQHTFCNPFSSLPDKVYRMELSVGENQHIIMEMTRKADDIKLRMVGGHYNVWLPQGVSNAHEHDMVWEHASVPPLVFDVTFDMLRDIRYLRRARFGHGAPGALEVQWISGQVSQFAGGVWYPPQATLDSAKAHCVANGTGVFARSMTRQLDGHDLDSIPLYGMPIHNMSLAADANAGLLSGTITELVGVAAEGADIALFPAHALSELAHLGSWARKQHNVHYAASDKLFDKMWCHPMYKRCESDGVVVPKNMSCPQVDATGRMLPPGSDGPSSFNFVAENEGCGGSEAPVRKSSQEFIQTWFNADASKEPGCFHLDTLPWDPSLPSQHYKLWCDTETGVAGLLSFPDSACDVNTGDWQSVWQLSKIACVPDPVLGYAAQTRCEALPGL